MSKKIKTLLCVGLSLMMVRGMGSNTRAIEIEPPIIEEPPIDIDPDIPEYEPTESDLVYPGTIHFICPLDTEEGDCPSDIVIPKSASVNDNLYTYMKDIKIPKIYGAVFDNTWIVKTIASDPSTKYKGDAGWITGYIKTGEELLFERDHGFTIGNVFSRSRQQDLVLELYDGYDDDDPAEIFRPNIFIKFSCGGQVQYCPEMITGGGGTTSDLFKNIVGEKPIPKRNGYKFVNWIFEGNEISYPNNQPAEFINSRYRYNKKRVNVGDPLINWDNYIIGNLYTQESEKLLPSDTLLLSAKWEKDPDYVEEVIDGQTIPINIMIPSTPINVTLPASIELVFDGSSPNAIVANNYTITNNSKVGILKARPEASIKDKNWTINGNSTESYYSDLPLDSKQIYFGISKDGNNWTSLNKSMTEVFVTLDPQGINGSSNSSQFSIKCMTGGSTSAIDSNLLDLSFVFSYKAVEPDVGPYTLTFDTNGGTEVSPMQFPVGSTITLRYQDTIDEYFSLKEGYILSGWSTEKNGTIIDSNIFKMPNKDTTLYAQWTELVSFTMYEKSQDTSPNPDIPDIIVPDENPDTPIIPDPETYYVPKGMSWREAIESNSIYTYSLGDQYYHSYDFTINEKNHFVFDDSYQHCALPDLDLNAQAGNLESTSRYCAYGE